MKVIISKRKMVLLPIEVPNNDYCWDGETPCPQFDNEGGHPDCSLPNMYLGLKYDEHGRVPKPDECIKLNRLIGQIRIN
jgi:hypothetical protein